MTASARDGERLRLVEPDKLAECLHERLLARVVRQAVIRGTACAVRQRGPSSDRTARGLRPLAGENDELGARAAAHS